MSCSRRSKVCQEKLMLKKDEWQATDHLVKKDTERPPVNAFGVAVPGKELRSEAGGNKIKLRGKQEGGISNWA